MPAREDWDALPVDPTIDGPLFSGPASRPEGPFDGSSEKPAPEEALIAGMIWKHRGRDNAVPIAQIAEVTKFDPRVIKTIVEKLRKKHRCQIGPRHQEPVGYFWIVDDEDRRLACAPFQSQMLAMWESLQILDTPQRNRELLERLRNRL
jgi:hypothetical protein